jgi:hypothetical protein
MRWFPLTLFLGTLLAVGQNPAPTATAADSAQKKIRVEGTILSLNGEAVRKATVRLQGTITQPGQPPTSYGESTDNDGKFVFEDVAAGRYMLSCGKSRIRHYALRRPLQHLAWHTAQSHSGNGTEGPGGEDDSPGRDRREGAGSGRRPSDWISSTNDAQTPTCADASNCNQPAA